jgi:MoaA/NifB/PqqE/SkfB family radical SAM enzyme
MLIELSSACNSNCKRCFRNKDRNITMSFWTFRAILDEIDRVGYWKHLYLTGQGEPLINPDIWKCLAYAKTLGYRTMISTNAKLLDPRNVDLFTALVDDIQISFDSFKNPALRDYDSGELIWKIDMVTKRLRRGNTFQINVLVSEDNWEELPDILKSFANINISVELQQLHHTKNHPEFKKEWEIQKRMLERVPELLEITKGYKNVVYYEFGGSFKRCFSRYKDFGITADQYIVPCAWRLDPSDFNLGSFANQTIEGIFFGERISMFRNNPDYYSDCCEPCIWIDEILESKGVIY